ncbi:urea ABC transporter permease subunit UrtB [Exilibacterium tricleocarpae]|uniref:Urea ABC transporter permease subunit UrtB n=1 Tax=Exilibacterium tricleocarpae TaxID=2591008 RepID=A0A545SYS4_9GAMM|nr:urea ABC transporter permease subunit UrtB [Exilibacterium tricleocarpae]TQV70123.1 urea ABC transporter permease subunit UrtB [Exilibacterium tricleocarpae]
MQKQILQNTALWAIVLVLIGYVFCRPVYGEGEAVELPALAQQLAGVKLKELPNLVGQLEVAGKTAVVPLFEALLNGDLYYRKVDRLVVIARLSPAGDYQLRDALLVTPLGRAEKKALKKIRISNRVRSGLRDAIARLTLFSDDPTLRRPAVANLFNRLDDDSVALLQSAAARETDTDILATIERALALHTLLVSPDIPAQLQALDKLDGSLEPVVRNRLAALLESTENTGATRDPAVIRKAAAVLHSIHADIEFYEFLETLFFGLSLGSVLLLVATGLAITFGVMGVINMAHGELIMLGAYTTYVVQLLMPDHIGYSLLVAVPAAFLVSAATGIVIERSVIRFLHGRPLETLLATFGISLLLQQTVRSVFSPLNRQVESPSWLSGSLELNAVFSLTYNRLYILVFALLVFVALLLVLKRTSLGLQVRAVAQNREMAKAMGIRTDWVDALTFGLGSGIAGIAGVALSQLTNVGPNLGQAYIIDSFMVVVFGGVGNLWGTLVGSFSLGIVNKFLEPATGAVLANILVLVFIILFIQKRPRGLFPQRGRAGQS